MMLPVYPQGLPICVLYLLLSQVPEGTPDAPGILPWAPYVLYLLLSQVPEGTPDNIPPRAPYLCNVFIIMTGS